MALDPTINRYANLLTVIPQGSWYASNGILVPLRDSPYEIQFTTDTPLQKYSLFNNGTFLGVVTTDAVGNVVVSVLCAAGENRIYLLNQANETTVQILLTCRNSARELAASAEVLEIIDDAITTIRLDASLATCLSTDLEAIWGNRTSMPALAYGEAVYRKILTELHLAQRLFAGKQLGPATGVAAITQIPPLDYFRLFDGKRWILGQTFLENDRFQIRSHARTPDVPLFSGVTALTFSAAASPGAAQLAWNPGLQQITYTDPVFGAITRTIVPGLSGAYEFRGNPVAAIKIGRNEPYNIAAGINDVLTINVDGQGFISITLPPGPQTALALAVVINAALVADPRYGGAYAAFAGTFGVGIRLRLTSSFTGDIGRIAFVPAPTVGQAALTIFANLTLPTTVRGFDVLLATATLDLPNLPGAGTIQNFTVHQAPHPDAWFPSIPTSYAIPRRAYTLESPTSLEALVSLGVGGGHLLKAVLPEADLYKGFPFRLVAYLRTNNAGVSAILGVTFDGVSFVEAAPVPIPQATDPLEDFILVDESFIYDPNATEFTIRVRFTGPVLGGVEVSRVYVDQPNVSAAFLASATIPRSRHRSFFGHLLWAWSPEILDVAESAQIGLGTPPVTPVGQIDKLSSAHCQYDRFNVTEYNIVTSEPINLKGVCIEAEWASVALTNLSIVPLVPTRFTYVAPVIAGVVITDPLAFPTLPLFIAGLPYPSDMDLGTSVLFADDVPVPQDEWAYVDENQILVLTPSFLSGATYRLHYRAVYRATSAPVDLGLTWADYVWFADAYIPSRYTADVKEIDEQRTLFIDFSTYTATFDRPVNTDLNSVRIIRSDGVEDYELPQDAYNFVSRYVISFDGAYIKPGALYTIQYREIGMTNTRRIAYRLEVRTAPDTATLAATPWREVERNQAVKTHDGYRFAQIRVTVTGVDTLTDFSLSSMVFKGLHEFGPNARIPGLSPLEATWKARFTQTVCWSQQPSSSARSQRRLPRFLRTESITSNAESGLAWFSPSIRSTSNGSI